MLNVLLRMLLCRLSLSPLSISHVSFPLQDTKTTHRIIGNGKFQLLRPHPPILILDCSSPGFDLQRLPAVGRTGIILINATLDHLTGAPIIVITIRTLARCHLYSWLLRTYQPF